MTSCGWNAVGARCDCPEINKCIFARDGDDAGCQVQLPYRRDGIIDHPGNPLSRKVAGVFAA
jgi:hypothetical protein